jgi:hypothetical protein
MELRDVYGSHIIMNVSEVILKHFSSEEPGPSMSYVKDFSLKEFRMIPLMPILQRWRSRETKGCVWKHIIMNVSDVIFEHFSSVGAQSL